MLKRITKSKKKGKLNKKDEDDKEEKVVPLSVYKKIFNNMGGFMLQVPFLISIAVYTYFEN